MASGLVAGMVLPQQAYCAALAVGQKAPSFVTVDTAGQSRTLEEFKGKIVVLEWTSPSCPFVRAQYRSGKIQELQGWAKGQGVVWLSVLSTNPGRGDYLNAAKANALNQERKAAPSALLIDSSGKMGRAYGARTTPHMFVIHTNAVLAYAGAIDTVPTVDEAVVPTSRNLVRAALEDLLAGRKVQTPVTSPYGCMVGYDA